MKRRLLSWILVIVMVCTMIPVNAMAGWFEQPGAAGTETFVHINPLYADVLTEEDLVQPLEVAEASAVPASEPIYATTFAEAGAQMREGMVQRQQTLVVYYQTDNYDSSQHKDIFNAAVAHTGMPKEGDALLWVYAGYKVSIRKSVQNGITYATFTYTMTYYTTAEQEAQMDAAVAQLFADLSPSGTDFQKLDTVYEYICDNISYDYDTLYDDDYKLKYTAYAALINKTAVCQGYAVLLYRLALEMGIDCRVITGIGNNGGHGWNIVKLGDVYYNTDSTWDAIWMQALGYYNYYLQCEYTFTSGGTDHYRDAEYDTTEFHALYPISATNFDPATDDVGGVPSEPDDEDVSWHLSDSGTLLISGSGEMNDYAPAASDAPWYSSREMIYAVIIEDGITRIGDHAFAGCTNLREITFLGDVPAFGTGCFENVTARAYYPAGNATWTADLLLDYGGFLQWLSYDAHSYSAVVTPPTCDQQGYTTYTCTGCGYSYKDHYVAASGHSWDDGVVTIEPTETVPGERLYTCLLCDCTKKVTIPVKDHVHTYTDTVTAPTCETQGYTTHVCACGESYVDSYVNANGHSMGDWHETQAPTCTMDGIKIKECANCEFYETGAVASTGHSYTIVITAPTCDTEGYTTHTCHCGEKYVDASVAALGHKFVDYISDGNADCTTDGTKTAACSRGCGATETVTDTGSATGHSYAQNVVAPTCVEKGYTVYTCRCGYSYQDNDVDALGHKFTNYVSDGNATCTNDGTKTAVCDNGCGSKDVVADAGSAKGHSYSETITAPTCTAQGYTTYLCHCGHSYTDHFVDATGHTFGEWYVVEEPTEAKDGLKRRDCSNCTHHEQETIVYVAGPDHITSDQFLIDEDTIQKIPANLTVGDFLAGIHEQEYVRVIKNGEAVALDSMIGTGMEVQLVVDGQVIMVLIAIVTGDVNGDGSITVTDMLQIKSQLLNKSKIEGVYALAADTNKDGNISITDFMQVKAHILGKSMITP